VAEWLPSVNSMCLAAIDGGWFGSPAFYLIGVGVLVLLWLLAGLRWPALLLRPFLWLLTHTLYRVRVYGQEHIPTKGPALLVCNHVSYIDWLLLLAAQKRFIRFVVWAPLTEVPVLRLLMRWAGVIAIDGSSGPRAIVASLRKASDALAQGDLVCIFAEGRITRTGFLLPFHRGLEQIVKHCPAPIIPVCLDHVWGSVFSYRGGKALWKWPQEVPYPVSVAFGCPLPPTTRAAEVRQAIQKLSADCAIVRGKYRRPVHRQFVRVAARHPFRMCLIDSATGQKLRYGEALAGAMLLAKRLRPLVGDDAMVGVWLPSSAGAALANVALALLGKTSVNLNYTAGQDSLKSAIRQCGLRKILTSRVFLHKARLEPGPGVEFVFLEDFRKEITRGQKLRAFLKVLVLPGWMLDRWVLGLGRTRLDDLITVIFSSGSTGEPKGVMLSHGNVAANAESMIQAIDLRKEDRALGILPFFHSFGYTVTLWAPLQVGASAMYHFDPRQAKEIGELCRTHKCTIYLSTPTFLRFSLRRCDKADFASVRLMACGAEKLPQALAQEFKEKFGILPLEAYGCTELSPAATANVPDREGRGSVHVGNKPGTIGQPLPGVAARVVDPETLQPLAEGQDGLLLIYGANVMKGYLGKPEQTAQVIRDGWYVTGDMARIDEDGFITLTGRLSRFAKVGGEMIPLEKIEEELQGILATNDRVCSVTAVPDERRGERVVVLHLELNGLSVATLRHKLTEKGLPNLWVPGDRDFFQVSELPLLGSGKVDLKRIKDIALSKVQDEG
jgi:acyl-[acyl-carrier-protein]-phospholipid O-acyltransferase/long-chain-fatty-acid--[acyl-carrier-protein] ligase